MTQNMEPAEHWLERIRAERIKRCYLADQGPDRDHAYIAEELRKREMAQEACIINLEVRCDQLLARLSKQDRELVDMREKNHALRERIESAAKTADEVIVSALPGIDPLRYAALHGRLTNTIAAAKSEGSALAKAEGRTPEGDAGTPEREGSHGRG